jgi:hypothetical protein
MWEVRALTTADSTGKSDRVAGWSATEATCTSVLDRRNFHAPQDSTRLPAFRLVHSTSFAVITADMNALEAE